MNEYGYIVISFLEIVKSNENEKKVRNTFGGIAIYRRCCQWIYTHR